jgi:protein-S-isoprenylcysteine O-methyltransferase Ste14
VFELVIRYPVFAESLGKSGIPAAALPGARPGVVARDAILYLIDFGGYVLVGIWFEERDLVAQFGVRYRRYRAGVGMLVPRRSRS